MLISSPQSEQFLPPFAESAAWMARALDAVLRAWYFRIAGMPAPWTADALAMCTDAELQAFFAEYDCANYYPDTPRARRVAMMAAQARLWRFLGTPDAVRELCRYVLKDAECDVEIQDCLAFDADGALVHPELLYIFDAAVVPGSLAASDADQERIVKNILKFASNRETLRNLYFDFEGTVAQRVRMCWAGDSADDTAEPAFCVPALGVPVGGTIDTDSQTVLYMPRVGGAVIPCAPVRNPKDFVLQTGSVPLDLGGAVIPCAPVRNPKDFELSGSMPLDGGVVSEDVSIEVDLIIVMYNGYEQMKGSIDTSSMCLANCMTQADADAVHSIGLETYGYATQYGYIGNYGAILYNPAYRFEILWFHSWYGDTQIPATNAIYVGSRNYTFTGETDPKSYFGLRLASGVNAYFFYADGHDPTDSSYSANTTACKYYHVKITKA